MALCQAIQRPISRRAAAKLRKPRIQIQRLIEEHPTYGYRRLWALLRQRDGIVVNRKAVYRVLVRKRWLVTQRTVTPRPRVQGKRSRAIESNRRWGDDTASATRSENVSQGGAR